MAAKTGYNPTKGRATFQEESDPKTGISNYLWMTEDEVIANIFFETKTGKVTNYQVLDRKRKSEADKKLSEEQALKAAVEAMSEFLPLTDKEMVLIANQYEPDQNLYKFDFTMLYQGYPLKLYYSVDEKNRNVAELVYVSPIFHSDEIDALTGEFYTFGEEEETE
ncbi:YcdB/YcdC domain-containing protein [Brevibacillus fortis]|uniref:YcdB/YcdC domain-containing protein n=1 Tax=Brevibacillus fortis TaxID=2126352 RepID=UPI001FCA0F83|nr:YcdB/YcdC domain-containing protein [Brevibacillus fortis]